MALDWRGDELSRRIRKAAIFGVNKTMAEAVEHAKRNHEWQNRTGILEGSIKITEFAARSGDETTGEWGSTDVRYALIHELGGTIVPRTAPALVFKVGDQWVRTQQVRIPARPYLRPAADATYGNLAENIREGMRR